jgi:hypothetical protein
MGLAPTQLLQILSSQNIVQSGGSIERSGKRYVLEPTGNYESIEDIRATLIRPPGMKDSVRLGDIAEVRHGYIDPPSSFFHQTGKPGLALAVSMRTGGNILLLGDQVEAKIRQLEEVYPWGLNFNFVNFQPKDVAVTIDAFTMSLLCGGDRDRSKRAPMGEAAGSLSDVVILTSDNPRTEDPEQILCDAEEGIIKTGKPYRKIADRTGAIHQAISEARDGDLVLIAGKGHEDYQIIGRETFHFDDKEVARTALAQRS